MMRDHHAVNRSVGRDRNIVNNPVDRIAQKFETGNKSYVEFTVRKLFAKCRRMIEFHLARPSSNERTSVEIFNAPDPQ
jgi:hypothetical protein